MNLFTLTLLIIVGLLVAYILYKYMYSNNTTIISSTALATATSPTSTPAPLPARVSFATWLYVNTFTQGDKTVFAVNSSLTSTPALRLYLDASSPSLNLDIATGTSSCASTSTTTTVQITDNFPLQRWSFVVVSFDGQIVDCYLDGKLIVSQQLTGFMTATCGGTATLPATMSISYGQFDAYIAQFQRINSASAPADVTKLYAYKPKTLLNLPSYGLNLQLLNNNAQVNSFKIL